MFGKIAELKVKIKELELEKGIIEKQRIQDRKELEQEFVMREKDLRHDLDLEKKKNSEETKNLEARLLLKHEQEVAELENAHEKKCNALEIEAKEKIVAEKERLNKKFYEDMTTSLQTIHEKGNHTTDFLKDVTMKMLDKNSIMRIDNNSTVPQNQTTINKVD